MSTRATYQFQGPSLGNHTFYIHSDGYPEGAAEYLFNAARTNAKGTFADAFYRGNSKAELTRDHEAHGDTEYRYTFTLDSNNKLTSWKAERRVWGACSEVSLNRKEFEIIAAGDGDALVLFINTQRGRWDKTSAEDIVIFLHPGHFTTAHRAQNELASAEAEHKEYCKKFPHFVGNIQSGGACLVKRAEALKEAIAKSTAGLGE